jgi:hypothetical protein
MARSGRRVVEQHRTHWAMVNLVAARYRQVLARKARADCAADLAAGGSGSVRD